tara:strand:- start:748 stop:942 length:195 start_codon:yes stop_codon:yes gene_type:complete
MDGVLLAENTSSPLPADAPQAAKRHFPLRYEICTSQRHCPGCFARKWWSGAAIKEAAVVAREIP